MAAIRRSESKRMPLDFSKSTKYLMRHADSFISAFDVSKQKMRPIVEEFQKIVDEVTKMQETTGEQRRKGACTGAILMAIAPLTLGLSLIGAAVAAADVVDANKTKIREENKSAHKVEELGKEFMKIVEPLKNHLEKIKAMCEELERRSAEGQAADTLSDMEEFQRILTHVSELAETSGEVLGVALTVRAVMRDMFMLILSVFRVTATPKEDQQLRDSIIQSADQCQKVMNVFDQMKVELRHLTGS